MAYLVEHHIHTLAVVLASAAVVVRIHIMAVCLAAYLAAYLVAYRAAYRAAYLAAYLAAYHIQAYHLVACLLELHLRVVIHQLLR